MTLSAGTNLGRYEIRSKIGEGGMGEVYLAQDTKLDRKVALKILPADVAAHQDRMKRFVQEAKAASALNHPNIITIHEIDQADSVHFIATEFVDGETLRRRMNSEHLKLGKALDVAAQITGALAAAHGAGIIHRDIKPENIMLRSDGIVKLLDFGLAKLTERVKPELVDTEAPTRAVVKTHPGVIMGTVTYMSPEQARGLPVDARTDIWSLGVVLYEMLSGEPPFKGPTTSDILAAVLEREPRPFSAAAQAVPTELRRIVAKALRKDRDERYQTVKDLLLDLRSLKQEIEFQAKMESSVLTVDKTESQAAINVTHSQAPHATSLSSQLAAQLRTHRIGALITLTFLVGALVLAYFYFNHRSALSDKDTILLADFVNNTGDATFDSTLKQALAVQLRQTPFLNLFPEEWVHETLRYMGRPDNERITPQIGREICQRRGLKALLVGTIAALGNNYVITLEAINGRTGEAIASQQVEAEGKERILKSLGDAALELRRQLGESLSTLQKYNAPIEQATTSSLEALNVYSKGLEQIYSGDYKDALSLFNRAVELDPNFAEAYVWLSWTRVNFGDFARGAEFAEKAYALRDRVTELEKLRIDDIYHLWATGDFDKQKEADDLIARLYPNDWVPHNSLAIAYIFNVGQPEKALAEAREATRLNPNEVHTYKHVCDSLIRLSRFDEARVAIREAQAQKLDHTYYRRDLYQISFALGDASAMQQQLALMIENDGEREALSWQARAASFAGRLREAQAFYRHVAELSGVSNLTGRGAPSLIEAAEREALFGLCRPDEEGVTRALAISRITSPGGFLYFPIDSDGSLCGDISAAQKLADELAKRYPKSTFANGVTVPVIRAAIELRRNQPNQAIEFLKATMPYEAAALFWPNYLRGQAYLRLSKGNEAATEFQKILDHRGWDPISPFYPLAHLGLARANVLAGDTAGSRKAYQDFFALWKDADSDLPILIEAKKEYERLS